MTEYQLKTGLGVFVVILTACLLVLVFLCYLMGGFYNGEFTTMIAVVFPMFTCYATPAFRHLVNERFVRVDESDQVSVAFIAISFGGTGMFALAIFGVIFLRAYGGFFNDFEHFEHVLLAVNSAFAIYIGYIIDEVFTRADTSTRRRRTRN